MKYLYKKLSGYRVVIIGAILIFLGSHFKNQDLTALGTSMLVVRYTIQEKKIKRQ